MVVLVVERATDGLRGSFRRWMIEVQAGVYVGRLSQRVREELWKRVTSAAGDGAAVMLWSARNEQGYDVWVHGDRDRRLVDLDGLMLVERTKAQRTKGATKSPTKGGPARFGRG